MEWPLKSLLSLIFHNCMHQETRIRFPPFETRRSVSHPFGRGHSPQRSVPKGWHCTGPVKGFLYGELGGRVQLPADALETSLWWSLRRWMPMDLSTVDKGVWTQGSGLRDLSQFPPAGSSSNSMIKTIRRPRGDLASFLPFG